VGEPCDVHGSRLHDQLVVEDTSFRKVEVELVRVSVIVEGLCYVEQVGVVPPRGLLDLLEPDLARTTDSVPLSPKEQVLDVRRDLQLVHRSA